MLTSASDFINVLVLDDDVELLSMLSELLGFEGIRAECVASWTVAREMLNTRTPDVLVLDLMLRDANGLEVCRQLRRQGSTLPILMLTARGEPMDRVLGLELGADDYLAKPFESRELVARIRALFRRLRVTAEPATPTLLRFAELDIDLVGLQVRYAKKLVHLSSTEFRLLVTLARQPGVHVSREHLSSKIQPGSYAPLDRAVDVQVTRLRRKLHAVCPEHEWITTVRNMGYVFTPPASRLT
jgi:two-component system, OmpR family, phosphate regulon response regulator OmpR